VIGWRLCLLISKGCRLHRLQLRYKHLTRSSVKSIKRGALEDFLSLRFCIRLKLFRQQHKLPADATLSPPSGPPSLMTLHKHLQLCKFETQIISKRITSCSQEPHWISGFRYSEMLLCRMVNGESTFRRIPVPSSSRSANPRRVS